MVRYEKPVVIDYGSISEHTFTRCGGDEHPKDWQTCALDKFDECSCHEVLSP